MFVNFKELADVTIVMSWTKVWMIPTDNITVSTCVLEGHKRDENIGPTGHCTLKRFNLIYLDF